MNSHSNQHLTLKSFSRLPIESIFNLEIVWTACGAERIPNSPLMFKTTYNFEIVFAFDNQNNFQA